MTPLSFFVETFIGGAIILLIKKIVKKVKSRKMKK